MNEEALRDKKITFIGAGNMAEALVNGIVKSGVCDPGDVHVTDVEESRIHFFRATFGVEGSSDNAAAVRGSDVVVLAVKPQLFPAVLPDLAASLSPSTVVVSIAAGVTCEKIEALLKDSSKVVRVMPNTPALIGKGSAAICSGAHAGVVDLEIGSELLRSVGSVVEVEEEMMDAVTAVSGSGPAYVFYLIEIMKQAAIDVGLDEALATSLVLSTVEGAAALAVESGVDAAELKARVTSKGGTTEAALNSLESAGLAEIFETAIRAARNRSRELSA